MTNRPPNSPEDDRWMQVALALGRRGLGTTWPNPSVGCVLVRDGTVVGRGWTRPGGRPHAETEALRRAGEAARGATAYVTLEPCSHQGRTPPCADALIEAGVARVVAACEDPDPRVSGRGHARMKAAGLGVAVSGGAGTARDAHDGYFRRQAEGRPLVSLKLATSLDGRIATAGGESQWITGPAARAWGHRLRAAHDVVLTGAGTVREDDPRLTVRLPGLPLRPPVRAVLVGRAGLPADARLLANDKPAPTWLIVAEGGTDCAAVGAEKALTVTGQDGRPDLAAALKALAQEGVTRVLVESGGAVAASALGAGVVDRVYWFRAPMVLGGDGRPAIDGLGVTALADAALFERRDVRAVGDDLLEIYHRREAD